MKKPFAIAVAVAVAAAIAPAAMADTTKYVDSVAAGGSETYSRYVAGNEFMKLTVTGDSAANLDLIVSGPSNGPRNDCIRPSGGYEGCQFWAVVGGTYYVTVRNRGSVASNYTLWITSAD